MNEWLAKCAVANLMNVLDDYIIQNMNLNPSLYKTDKPDR